MESESGFDYVITRPPPAKICFGSIQERKVLPLPQQDRRKKDISLILHPKCRSEFATKKNEKGESKESSSFASKVPRFDYKLYNYGPSIYSHCDYYKKPIKRSWTPFGKSVRIQILPFTTLTPGPGTYIFHQRKYTFHDSFGGRKTIIPAVATKCSSQQLTICYMCNDKPNGDYYQNWKTKLSICRPCMKNEKHKAVYNSKTKSVKYKRLAELSEYSRVRDCTYYHEHQNTTACIKLLTPIELQRKFRRENYLSMFNL